MVSKLDLIGDLGFESSPYNLISMFIWKSIIDSDTPRAWVWGHVHMREGV